MILDPYNNYIKAINLQTQLTGTTVLEIGCGEGRITYDMAKHATKVVATDLDSKVLEQAKKNVTEKNIEFLYSPDGLPALTKNFFDIVIYTLSLHHIPKNQMINHLRHSGSLLKKGGKIIVLEPGDSGSFIELKKRFNAGSGDESQEKQEAISAMKNLEGWMLSPTYLFEVFFQFSDENDFIKNKLPHHSKMAANEISELKKSLKKNSTDQGIILTSERRLNLLTKNTF